MTDLPNVMPGVLEAIREHVRTTTDTPVGGILIGWVEGESMTVERAVPTPQAEEHSGELVFTPPCWDLAYAELEKVDTESRIVGWYHASPNHGTHLSSYDRSLHRTLFPDPANVTLVVEAGSDEIAWFGWEVERITPLPSDADGGGTGWAFEAVPAAAARRRRGLARGAAALLLVAAVAAGAFVWGHSGRRTGVVDAGSTATLTPVPTGSPDSTGSPGVQQELQQARMEIESLRSQLASEQAKAQEREAQLAAARKKLKAARKKAKAPTSFVLEYHVKPGDTLFRLAETFYGTGRAWAKIAQANKTPNPDHIEIGTVLKIPLQNPN